MTPSMRKTREWFDVDAATFRKKIVPRNEPAVLRGLIRSWPAVQAGLRSPEALCDYLRRFDRGGKVEVLMGDASIHGRFFYQPDMSDMNFTRRMLPFGGFLDALRAHFNDATPPALAIQATAVPDYLPDFVRENAVDVLNRSIAPRIWIGNAVTVVTHFDPSENLGCVVGGRRRFTFFPPEQLPNLYVGPFDYSPAGIPVSMVNLDEPDLVRYPRFERALAAAQVAELAPGDAVYIPYFWWHHVHSLEPFNVLVNFWWNDAPAELGSPLDCFLHALSALRDLPPAQRATWRMVFDYYVFQTDGDPVAHLPAEYRGVLGPLTPELRAQIKAALLRALNRS
jgi:Cupin-like domain